MKKRPHRGGQRPMGPRMIRKGRSPRRTMRPRAKLPRAKLQRVKLPRARPPKARPASLKPQAAARRGQVESPGSNRRRRPAAARPRTAGRSGSSVTPAPPASPAVSAAASGGAPIRPPPLPQLCCAPQRYGLRAATGRQSRPRDRRRLPISNRPSSGISSPALRLVVSRSVTLE